MPEPTPEQLGREAGEAIANAIADNLESVLMKMADAIARVQAEQGELRDEVNGLANDLRTLRHRLDNEQREIRIHTPGPRPLEP